MTKRNRIIAIIVAVAMAIGLVSSALFVVENANHKCTGTDCQICDQINLSLKAFDNQTPKPEEAMAIVCVVWALVLALGLTKNIVKVDTLVDLKTKLSN